MLENKVALISGASRGIGQGIALLFAKHGAFVGINYVENEDAAEKTLTMVRDSGGDGMLLKGDVADRSDVQTIVQKIIRKKGHVDILVNNAGIYIRNKFAYISEEDWNKLLSVNLTSCFHLSQEVLPYIPEGGRIIFVSSQLAFRGSAHGSDYATTKAGMLGLMRSLALEYAKKGILVNAVAPGIIDTDIIGHYSTSYRQQRIDEIPLKRFGLPEDIANVCLFLASGLAGYVTGETINVNGGIYIH